jgi:hypothetical protein
MGQEAIGDGYLERIKGVVVICFGAIAESK